MFRTLTMYWQRRRAHKAGLRLRSLGNVARDACLEVGLPFNLGHTQVNTRAIRGVPARLGANSYIKSGELDYIQAIGKYCSMGTNVRIGIHGQNHSPYFVSTYPGFQAAYVVPEKYTVIGNDVWVGNNAVILAGVTVGHGAIIGMNAIVTRNVEPYEIVAGIPARHIRYRFDEVTRQRLIDSRWWDIRDELLKPLDFSDVGNFLEKIADIRRIHGEECEARDKFLLIRQGTISGFE